MSQPKRILVICGFRIFPPDTGGMVHTTTISSVLARMGHEVRVFCLAGRREDYSLARMLRGESRRVQIEPRLTEETHLGMLYGAAQALARRFGIPRIWQYELMRRGIVPRRLKEELRKADLILADLSFCPPVPGPWAQKPWFLISHELEFRLFEQGQRMARCFAARMRRIEEHAPRRYRDIFACAEEDHDFFRDHDPDGRLRLPYIRSGVDAARYLAAPSTRERVRGELGLTDEDWLIIFSGSSYAPNIEALESLRRFCRTESDFLARLRVSFLVLGSMVPYPNREGALIATGRVPDVVPYFAAGDAGLNPITRGSGSNVKLFEYLAARLPVISTRFGVRGTPLTPEIDYLPYELDGFKTAIERFVRERSREQWRAHGEQVFARHRRWCDMPALVEDAIAQRPEFSES